MRNAYQWLLQHTVASAVILTVLTLPGSVWAQSGNDREAERHYKTAMLAVKDGNLPIAAEEMQEAAKLAPDNAVVLYGLAVVQARNQQPEEALRNLDRAVRMGLPPK